MAEQGIYPYPAIFVPANPHRYKLFMVLIRDVAAFVFAVLPRSFRVLHLLSMFPALVGAVRLAPCHREGAVAHRTGLCFLRRIPLQGPFQRGIDREDGTFKVAAQRPSIPFVEHVTFAVQRQAAVFTVVVGAQGCDQKFLSPILSQ